MRIWPWSQLARLREDAEHAKQGWRECGERIDAANMELHKLRTSKELYENSAKAASGYNREAERERGIWRGRAEGLRRALRLAERQLETVTAQLAELRREGFNPPAETGEPQEAPNVVTPRVMQALRASMTPDSPAYNSMLRSAARLLADGDSEEKVVEWISDGADPDDFLT